jgi:hypothetical protein
MARGRVFTAPKAFIKIDNEVAGYVRNLTFSENVQRANVQGLGSLTYQEAPPVVYTCQWSVSQYFISFNTPVHDLTIEGKEYYRRHKSDIITSILSGSGIDGYDINTGSTITGTLPLEEGQTTAVSKTFNLVATDSIPNGFEEIAPLFKRHPQNVYFLEKGWKKLM